MVTAPKRLQKEIMEIKGSEVPGFRDFKVDDGNLLIWEGLVVPTEVPYNKGAFRVEVTFPDQYPFKPPTIMFKTKIFHPNVDEEGRVCLNIINPENWKPATKAKQILEALIRLINTPEPDHPLRADLAEDYVKNRAKFNKSAEAFTKKHTEKRPA